MPNQQQYGSSFKQPPIPPPPHEMRRPRGESPWKLIGKIFGGLVAVAVIIWAVSYFNIGNLVGGEPIDANSYYAVFLINGQVYFGKMEKNNSQEIVINNVYYLQAADNPSDVNASSGQTHFNLIKLGAEIHGPTDELFVNKSQTLFYEKLRADSTVVQKIQSTTKSGAQSQSL